MRPALRLWGALDVLYGALIAWLALSFIPKDPLLPPALAAYGALSALGGVGLWRGARWGWRLSVGVGAAGLALGVALISLTLMAGLYWRGVFGVLGWGVLISSVLLISGLAQLLALYPALRLRRLLSREVRGFFSHAGGGRPPPLSRRPAPAPAPCPPRSPCSPSPPPSSAPTGATPPPSPRSPTPSAPSWCRTSAPSSRATSRRSPPSPTPPASPRGATRRSRR